MQVFTSQEETPEAAEVDKDIAGEEPAAEPPAEVAAEVDVDVVDGNIPEDCFVVPKVPDRPRPSSTITSGQLSVVTSNSSNNNINITPAHQIQDEFADNDFLSQPPPTFSSSTTPIRSKTRPPMSLNDKKNELDRFERNMFFSEATKAEFETWFTMKLINEVDDQLYAAWLPLKIGSLGSEAESFAEALEAWKESNTPRKKTGVKRKRNVPDGADHWLPQSTAYKACLETAKEQQKEKEAAKKKKLEEKKSKETLKMKDTEAEVVTRSRRSAAKVANKAAKKAAE